MAGVLKWQPRQTTDLVNMRVCFDNVNTGVKKKTTRETLLKF